MQVLGQAHIGSKDDDNIKIGDNIDQEKLRNGESTFTFLLQNIKILG